MSLSVKKQLKIILLIFGVACAILFIPWSLVVLLLSPLPDTIQEQIEDSLDYGLDGIILYVDHGGISSHTYAAGMKNKEENIAIEADDLFKIASISKLYIAAAAAKLIARDSLSLDKTLYNYLPHTDTIVMNAPKITLRMLLQHRSGIPDWIEDSEFPWENPPTDEWQLLELVKDDSAEFEPDSKYDYSNTNYLLVAHIMDSILGFSHREFIHHEILQKLGLKKTHGLQSDVDDADIVSGYHSSLPGDVKSLNFVSPGGSMISTAKEVGIFLRALNDSTLFTTEQQEIYSSIYEYEHTGLLPGYQSIARYHKDIDSVVIIFTNTSGGNAWSVMSITYNRILRILKNSGN